MDIEGCWSIDGLAQHQFVAPLVCSGTTYGSVCIYKEVGRRLSLFVILRVAANLMRMAILGQDFIISSDRSSCSDDVPLGVRQPMFEIFTHPTIQESLYVALTVSKQLMSQDSL